MPHDTAYKLLLNESKPIDPNKAKEIMLKVARDNNQNINGFEDWWKANHQILIENLNGAQNGS